MTLNILAVEQIKPVYSDDFQTIFIPTNRPPESSSSQPTSNTLNKYLYSNGDFFNISGKTPVLCNKTQHSFLLGLMTSYGVF
ncbi:hypothetical protein [Shewanella aestuarii]|uniref:Uncharacterized protein n=1 Tax=Shewanella aestuarii TaxID=1028752 RepID=A0A6G9QPE4_9GAMM|nr:hypothetical protein [Shewanella aestuarii]QIR16352.1 hypothetical protein HBH39_17860 [Shewanella aestuarii]